MQLKQLTDRAVRIESSPTLALNSLVNQLKKDGKTIINLSLGQLDFSTPDNVNQAAIKAIRAGKTRYTATEGILPLRQAIAVKWEQQNGFKTNASQIIVGVGAKQLLYEALMVLCQKGDQVLLPVPTWSTYLEQIKLTEAEAAIVDLGNDFRLTARKISEKLTPQTKALIINSPSNPTGRIIAKEELAKIAQLALDHNFYLIADEIYEDFVYQGEHVSVASLSEEIAKKTITISGLSKSYAMTGWRVGYATGPEDIINKMIALQSQSTSNTSSISQWAALTAIEDGRDSIKKFKIALERRREFLCKSLSKIPGFKIIKPEGAFYFFVSLEKTLQKSGLNSTDWAKELLKRTGVAVVPGEAFLKSGFFRISYAASDEDLKKAVAKIMAFQKELLSDK